MNTQLLYLMVILFPATEGACAFAEETDVSKVRATFEAYRSAIIAKQGAESADLVSSSTLSLYKKHRDLALKGDEPTIRKLPLGERLQVLLMRHRIPLKTLKKLDGKAVFAYAVDQNWIGKKSVQSVGIGDIRISKSKATAAVTVNGETNGESFHFQKENGDWKHDLTPTLKGVDRTLKDAAKKKAVGENDLLFTLITQVSGRKVTDSIWQPLER
jgi:hypothetical protein